MRGSAYEYDTKPWKARTCEIIEDMGAEDVGGDSRWLSKSGNTDSVSNTADTAQERGVPHRVDCRSHKEKSYVSYFLEVERRP